jgi:hypothetical protein
MFDYKLHHSFLKSTSDHHSHLDHTWTNALTLQYSMKEIYINNLELYDGM